MVHVYVNKTTGEVYVGCIGCHLQLLCFYVENNKVNANSSTYRTEIEKRREEKTSQQPGILRAVTHPGSNISEKHKHVANVHILQRHSSEC